MSFLEGVDSEEQRETVDNDAADAVATAALEGMGRCCLPSMMMGLGTNVQFVAEEHHSCSSSSSFQVQVLHIVYCL